ncbi:MAG: peptide chain release factor-like protein [Chlamydiales bacterium]|nr:peptide chain release factor-like protein [Chlamydiales bacterium]
MIREEKLKELEERMKSLGIDESDLLEKFVLGSGSGGQKINKTSSCVYLKHIPTGLEVKCQQDRSRELNRFFARRTLCELYDSLINNKKNDRQKQQEKIQKQKKRRTRRSSQS